MLPFKHLKQNTDRQKVITATHTLSAWRLRSPALTAAVQLIDSQQVDVGHVVPLANLHRGVRDGRDGFLSVIDGEIRPDGIKKEKNSKKNK